MGFRSICHQQDESSSCYLEIKVRSIAILLQCTRTRRKPIKEIKLNQKKKPNNTGIVFMNTEFSSLLTIKTANFSKKRERSKK